MKGIVLGFDIWVLDEGVAYPPLIMDGSRPLPGRATNLSMVLKAGTRIYLKPNGCKCGKQKSRGKKK